MASSLERDHDSSGSMALTHAGPLPQLDTPSRQSGPRGNRGGRASRPARMAGRCHALPFSFGFTFEYSRCRQKQGSETPVSPRRIPGFTCSVSGGQRKALLPGAPHRTGCSWQEFTWGKNDSTPTSICTGGLSGQKPLLRRRLAHSFRPTAGTH